MPDFVVASTTATQEEVDHAVSADWRNPIPVKEPEKTPETRPENAEVETEETPVVEETETESVPEAETTQEDRPRGRGGFQKKIDKLTREKGELAARLAEYEDRFKSIEDRLAKPAETKTERVEAQPSTKPLESDIGTKFKDWNEFNEALIDWKAAQLVAKTLADRDKNAEEREAKETQESRDVDYKSAAQEFQEQTPDFNEAILNAGKAGMKLPEPIIELIKELPNGPAVTYYLVKNPDEALALIQMTPAMGFVAIGRISQGLEMPAEQPKPPARKIVSTAPHAVKPVAGNSAKLVTTLHDISKTGDDAYVRARMAQIKERDRQRYS